MLVYVGVMPVYVRLCQDPVRALSVLRGIIARSFCERGSRSQRNSVALGSRGIIFYHIYNLLHVVGFLRSRVAIIPIWRPPRVGVVPGDALKWERAGSHEMARCSYAAALRSGGNQNAFSYELGLNHQFFATPWPRGWSIRASATPAADRHGRALKRRRAGAHQNGKGSKKQQHQATVYLKTSRLILLAPPADKMASIGDRGAVRRPSKSLVESILVDFHRVGSCGIVIINHLN